jgi:hypothetical protein
VTVALPASNIAVVEQRAEVLIAGRPAGPGGPGEPAAGWPPSLGSLAGDITAAILREVPDYAQSDDPDVARVVRRVAREAVAGLSARVAQPGTAVPAPAAAPPPAASLPATVVPATPLPATGEPAGTASAGTVQAGTVQAGTVQAGTVQAGTVQAGTVQAGTVQASTVEAAVPVFRDLGRLLALEGRSLGALQAALRVGARVTWQRLHEQARQGHGTPAEFARAGEVVFWYMDELAAACSAGYAEARAELAGETSQLRRHLLDLLTASSAPPLPAIAGLAQASGWPLPRRVAAVALSPLAAASPGMLPPDMLADLTRRDPCLLIPDPDGPGRRRQVTAALGGWLTAADHRGASRPGAGPPPPGPPPPGPPSPPVPPPGGAPPAAGSGFLGMGLSPLGVQSVLIALPYVQNRIREAGLMPSPGHQKVRPGRSTAAGGRCFLTPALSRR